jgi:hypothetical protein
LGRLSSGERSQALTISAAIPSANMPSIMIRTTSRMATEKREDKIIEKA